MRRIDLAIEKGGDAGLLPQTASLSVYDVMLLACALRGGCRHGGVRGKEGDRSLRDRMKFRSQFRSKPVVLS